MYERFQHAVSAVRTLGRGSLLAKLDLKDAFRHIPVRPADWNLLGYSWQGQFYYDVVLTFGLKSAPYIFNLFAEALHWIISRHIPATLKHYLDDFLPVFSPRTPVHMANAAIEWIMGLGSTLGLSFQPEKTVWPTTRLEFLGLTLDTDLMQASLPPDKLEYLQELTSLWASRARCSLHDLQELTGFLQFASQVIPVSRAFIRRLIDFSATFTSPFQRRRVPAAARRDIWWWDHFASSWNGIQLIQPTRKTLYVYTDASGKKGMGGIFGNLWFSARVARRYRHFDIQVKEIAAVLEAVLRWGSAFRGCHVIFHVDNEAIVSALRDSTIRSPMSMGILRMFLMLSASLDFTFSAVWISTNTNALADAASRFEYARLFSLNPELNPQPSSRDRPTLGIKRTLTFHGWSRSTCGMASPPLPAALTLQARRASSTSLSSIDSSMTTVPSSQQASKQSWSGSHGSEPESSRRRSRHTSVTSAPSTSMLTSPSLQPSTQLFNASSAGSAATMVKRIASPGSQSRWLSSSTSQLSLTLPQCQTTQYLTPHSSLLSPASSGAASLRWKRKASSTRRPTSPAAASSSSHPWRTPHTSNLHSRHPKPIHFARESQFLLLPLRLPPLAQSQPSGISSLSNQPPSTALYSPCPAPALPSRAEVVSSAYGSVSPAGATMPPSIPGTVSGGGLHRPPPPPAIPNTRSNYSAAGGATLTSSI